MRFQLPLARAMACPSSIPLFAERPFHPSAPLGDASAVARSRRQGRPLAGACALPLTAASTMARSRQSGNRGYVRVAFLIVAGGISVIAPAPPTRVHMAATRTQAASDPFRSIVMEAAQRFGIPAAWIRAVMRVESRGERRVISPKGAMGVMQLMPDTWAALRVRPPFSLLPSLGSPGQRRRSSPDVQIAHRPQISRLRIDPRAMLLAAAECVTCRQSRRSPKACSLRSRRQDGSHDCAHSTSSEAESPILFSRLSGAHAGADERTQARGQAISPTTDRRRAR
jgi:hypothetical protein